MLQSLLLPWKGTACTANLLFPLTTVGKVHAVLHFVFISPSHFKCHYPTCMGTFSILEYPAYSKLRFSLQNKTQPKPKTKPLLKRNQNKSKQPNTQISKLSFHNWTSESFHITVLLPVLTRPHLIALLHIPQPPLTIGGHFPLYPKHGEQLSIYLTENFRGDAKTAGGRRRPGLILQPASLYAGTCPASKSCYSEEGRGKPA